MSDLMRQKTTYKKLEEKYFGFVVPTVELKVGNSKLPPDIENHLDSVTLELSCITSEMNVLSFTLSSLYNYEKQAFDMEVIDTYFKLGNDVEVHIGYVKTEPLFKGYIFETSYTLDVNEGLNLTVSCKDFKGLLANKQGDAKRKGSSRIGEVKNILTYSGYQKYGKLASTKSLSQLEQDYAKRDPDKIMEEHDPLSSELEKVQALAEEHGHEFFVLYNEVYFRPNFSETGSPILAISPGKGLIGADLSLSLAEMVSKVEVRGYEENNLKTISGSMQKNIPAKITTNNTALGCKIIFDESISDEAMAKAKAKNILLSSKWQCSKIKVRTIGIPDIVPGRMIKIEGLSQNLDKNVYIEQVSHQISTSEGYSTSFTGRIDLYG